MKTYCDSLDCPDGLALIAGASDVQCKRFKCTEAECCETACSSFDCPTNLLPVEVSDTTVCEDSGCTEDLCCEMGKTSYEILSICLTRTRHVVTISLEFAGTQVRCLRRASSSRFLSLFAFHQKLPFRREQQTPLFKPRLTPVYSLRTKILRLRQLRGRFRFDRRRL